MSSPNETKIPKPGDAVVVNPLLKTLYEKWRAQMGMGNEQTAATPVLAEVNLMSFNLVSDLQRQNAELSKLVDEFKAQLGELTT